MSPHEAGKKMDAQAQRAQTGWFGIAVQRLLCLLCASASFTQAGADEPVIYTPEQVRIAIDNGLGFLLTDQNPDGSWGGPRGAVYTFTGDVWSNPETHRAWKTATTGLCVMALLEAGTGDATRAAALRGVDYVIAHADTRRPSEWDTMNCWAELYGLQALAMAYGHASLMDSPNRETIRAAAQQFAGKLGVSQSISGGWGYLEFSAPRTRRTQWATSFSTAAGLIALQDAKREGIAVDAGVVARAVKAIERCRLPSGAFTYSVQAIATPRHSEWIDQVKGSLSRIQVCNLALLEAGEDVPVDTIRTGLGHFFREHKFLDIARNRPIPHETYYLNSGYFYLFGHYYAARMIEQLPPAEQAEWWPKLQREIIKVQQKDGSMWDYDMHAYHKPYGVAFGVMALQRSIKHHE